MSPFPSFLAGAASNCMGYDLKTGIADPTAAIYAMAILTLLNPSERLFNGIDLMDLKLKQ
jgi:hypothetical protein